MKHKIRSLVLLLMAVGGSIAPAAHGAAPEPRVHRVEITGFAFVPSHIDARAGDSIEFTNRDFAAHTAAADSKQWSTGELKNGASRRIVMERSGTFAYHCELHPHMKGDIVVKAASGVR